MIISAKLTGIPSSEKKLSRSVELVRGHKATLALEELKLIRKKGATFAYKLLQSAIANAENNFKLDKEKLYIEKFYATEGIKSPMRRYRFEGRGRVKPYRRFRSNLYIELKYVA